MPMAVIAAAELQCEERLDTPGHQSKAVECARGDIHQIVESKSTDSEEDHQNQVGLTRELLWAGDLSGSPIRD